MLKLKHSNNWCWLVDIRNRQLHCMYLGALSPELWEKITLSLPQRSEIHETISTKNCHLLQHISCCDIYHNLAYQVVLKTRWVILATDVDRSTSGTDRFTGISERFTPSCGRKATWSMPLISEIIATILTKKTISHLLQHISCCDIHLTSIHLVITKKM